jgi:hypothetical protein
MLSQHKIPSTRPAIFSTIQSLTDQAKRLAFQHDLIGLKHCMNLVQQIYKTGNSTAKNAVENIFVFAFSSILSHCNRMEWRLVQSCMPGDLYAIYVHQVLRSTC